MITQLSKSRKGEGEWGVIVAVILAVVLIVVGLALIPKIFKPVDAISDCKKMGGECHATCDDGYHPQALCQSTPTAGTQSVSEFCCVKDSTTDTSGGTGDTGSIATVPTVLKDNCNSGTEGQVCVTSSKSTAKTSICHGGECISRCQYCTLIDEGPDGKICEADYIGVKSEFSCRKLPNGLADCLAPNCAPGYCPVADEYCANDAAASAAATAAIGVQLYSEAGTYEVTTDFATKEGKSIGAPSAFLYGKAPQVKIKLTNAEKYETYCSVSFLVDDHWLRTPYDQEAKLQSGTDVPATSTNTFRKTKICGGASNQIVTFDFPEMSVQYKDLLANKDVKVQIFVFSKDATNAQVNVPSSLPAQKYWLRYVYFKPKFAETPEATCQATWTKCEDIQAIPATVYYGEISAETVCDNDPVNKYGCKFTSTAACHFNPDVGACQTVCYAGTGKYATIDGECSFCGVPVLNQDRANTDNLCAPYSKSQAWCNYINEKCSSEWTAVGACSWDGYACIFKANPSNP